LGKKCGIPGNAPGTFSSDNNHTDWIAKEVTFINPVFAWLHHFESMKAKKGENNAILKTRSDFLSFAQDGDGIAS